MLPAATRKSVRLLFSVLLILAIAIPAWSGTSVVIGADPTRFVIKGKLVTPDETIEGKLVIEGDTIKCAGSTCEEPPGATILTVTDAYIFPGFIDAHIHVAYNVFPKWKLPKLYQNRGQWQRSTSYKEFKKPYKELKDKLYCEMVKYGEIKALISGVTTIQGTPPDRKCIRTLVRNAENQNELDVPGAHIRTYILDIKTFEGKIDTNVTKSFVVHIGEGVDDGSRKEFDTLKAKGLLSKETAIIHGTAFKEAEFDQMAQVGAKLIWSPQSNLALYGKTTDVKLALSKGVPVSLGVDWNPTGSDTMFDELRIADKVNDEQWGGVIPDDDWVKMITANPARALALDGHIGNLRTGLKADLPVLKSRDPKPAQSLLQSRLEDVEMVWVGGKLLYGDESVVEKVKPGLCEALKVHGAGKRVCVKDPKDSKDKKGQTLSQIRRALRRAYPGLAPLAP